MTPKYEKKLIYVLNYVSADDTQHYVHVLRLLAELVDLGWKVVVISEKGGEGSRNVLGHDVRFMSKRGGVERLFRLAGTLVSLRRQGYRLVFVRISRPAILVSSIVGRIVGQRTMYWLSSANQDLDQAKVGWRRGIYKVTMAATLTLINKFVTGPETMAAYFKLALSIPEEKLMVLYNDVDLSRFSPVPKTANPGTPTRILFVHSLSPNKEASRYFPDLIACLSSVSNRLGNIRLDVIGEGPERQVLETIAGKAGGGLVVEFLGGVPNMAIVNHYARADIFIMPSYREGFPRVVVEAMAMGLPIVATDAGGTRDLFGEKQQAFIVSRDDPAAFAAKLVDLVSDPIKRSELAQENLARVQRYSTKAVARMYNSKLLSVLEESR
ncbi:glycosyltransferase family 4 protein [Mesorhizobium sp.]|uniref:glycosyltransferase family 4 protein n=1 Tax=Mesorhizobium sp. TaxID=1871066 RepID=UPI000FE3D416|nr:glycosyltransferase family 4 protein [Mesorhizobium sp.]RWN55626.1 MAG: glycosyltransferase family 1 protein [Mesorhizobium sp.]RWN77223.1 MAG: glycosyltransferase family 1 protein [Mesorhizobium sp.]RWN80238.1 MAG: glycosyltransferase family 1 protein [Mesorhizobium sp.]RWN86151.1 MAG: glycosyltransferase family 1 protein [Mesorhizobium sp.]RWO14959.1 MAG: glycosyltransferase family 1 protein [Mesorhizobium sp.]